MILASDVGAGCRVGTPLPGSLGLSVLFCHMSGGLSRGGAGVPLTPHERKHAERKKTWKGRVSHFSLNLLK